MSIGLKKYNKSGLKENKKLFRLNKSGKQNCKMKWLKKCNK